jgi:phosphoribosyl-dephospho-CoA transferase
MTAALPRHTLVWPSAAAHRHLAAQLDDAEARAAIDTWFTERLPFIVRRPDAGAPAALTAIALGLPLPPAQRKRRIALRIASGDIAHHTPPPALDRVAALLPSPWRDALTALDRDARALGVRLRVFGSAAWQALTGRDYLHGASDLDILYRADHAQELAAVLALFARWERRGPIRLDGEIVFPGDHAVAWREWSSGAAAVMAKHLDGPALVARTELAARLATSAAPA